MLRQVGRRVVQGLVTLFVLATIVFILARVIGNPVDMLLPSEATAGAREEMIHRLRLDEPYYVQYLRYMGGLLVGDLGDSLRYQQPVMTLFLQSFPNTLRLAAVAMTFALAAGFALGVLGATHKDGLIDRGIRAVTVFGMSVPAFWLGIMLILIFSVKLRLLPVARVEGWQSYILPAITWSMFLLAGVARLVRSSMIEVMDTEYVKLARIKGVPRAILIWKHCLRNALLPVITFAGVQLAFLLNGSVVVEAIFAWPGVGRLIYSGIVGRDYPLVQGCLLIVGFMIVVINLLVDILYTYVDPRIAFDEAR
ncbi:MAG TPA: ABC transporter permease [Devosia sp.]|nr:ABC transporter permease [Devosia sp.]